MTQKAQIEALQTQANHYRDRAKEIALDLFQNPEQPEADKLKLTARGHLIRAESFTTAIKLITGVIKPVCGQQNVH